MTEEADHNYPPRVYWHLARRERIKARFYSPYRAIPAIVIFVVQFLWRHKAHSPFTEMWIGIGIVVVVYWGFFLLESVWRFVALTPPKIYGEQHDAIGEIAAKNWFLEGEIQRLETQIRAPEISPQEQRRRQLASEEVKKLGEIGRKVLRCVADHGELKVMVLLIEYKFDESAINGFLGRATRSSLIRCENQNVSINPELKSAIEFVLTSEYHL